MENRVELIVYVEERFSRRMIKFCSIAVAALLMLLLFVNYTIWGSIPLVGLSINSLLMFCLICASYVIFTFDPKKPFYIFNKSGVFIQWFGFVSWDEIREVGVYPLVKDQQFPRCLGFYFVDPSKISRQSSISGKLRIFWAKKFGYPSGMMIGLDRSPEEIIEFVKQFIDQQDKKVF